MQGLNSLTVKVKRNDSAYLTCGKGKLVEKSKIITERCFDLFCGNLITLTDSAS
jgi:hypothetical protein